MQKRKLEIFMEKRQLEITSELAHLSLKEDEKQKLSSEIEKMLEYFEVMDRFQVEAESGYLSELELRDDMPFEYRETEELLEKAQDSEDEFFTVPNVL
jgi:aspartyl/glutamyl-tRNA(Asn/Gln) amidotransferase C subunit